MISLVSWGLLAAWTESFTVLLSCANYGLCYLILSGITKFKIERKNGKDSGRSSKMTPSSKRPISELNEAALSQPRPQRFSLKK